jgi:hypothetical protein
VDILRDYCAFSGAFCGYGDVWAMNNEPSPRLQIMLSLCMLSLGDIPAPQKSYLPPSNADVAKAIRAKQQELNATNFRKRLPRNHPDKL